MPQFDYVIFGAGLAGLSISHQLIKRKQSVLLIDPNGAGGGASGTPAGLVNPAAARRARPTWHAEACMAAVHQTLKLIQKNFPDEVIFKATGVLRPAITEELTENFERALSNYLWPDGWISWLNEEETMAVNPDLAPNFGGLFLHCGLSVYMDEYCKYYLEHLQNSGVVFWNQHSVYQENESGYTILNKQKKSAVCGNIIICAGANSEDFLEWNSLPLHTIKGEIAGFKLSDEPAWDHAVSALGYATRKGKDEIYVGSTYDHHFETTAVSKEGLQELTQKFGNMLPDLAGDAEVISHWAGIRTATPNRLPFVGTHPQHQHMHIYTGLGSKGLLYSEYVAGLLADYLLSEIPLPDEIDVRRVFKP